MAGSRGPDLPPAANRSSSLFANERGGRGAVTPTGSPTHENETLIQHAGTGGAERGGTGGAAAKAETAGREQGRAAAVGRLSDGAGKAKTPHKRGEAHVPERSRGCRQPAGPSGAHARAHAAGPPGRRLSSQRVLPPLAKRHESSSWRSSSGCSFKVPCGGAFLSDGGISSPLRRSCLTRRCVTSETCALLEEPGALSARLAQIQDSRAPHLILRGRSRCLGSAALPSFKLFFFHLLERPGGILLSELLPQSQLAAFHVRQASRQESQLALGFA